MSSQYHENPHHQNQYSRQIYPENNHHQVNAQPPKKSRGKLIEELSKIGAKINSIEDSCISIKNDLVMKQNEQQSNEINIQQRMTATTELGQTNSQFNPQQRMTATSELGQTNSQFNPQQTHNSQFMPQQNRFNETTRVVEMHYSKYIKQDTSEIFHQQYEQNLKKIHQDDMLNVYGKVEEMNLTNRDYLIQIESLKNRVKEYQSEIMKKTNDNQAKQKRLSEYEIMEKDFVDGKNLLKQKNAEIEQKLKPMINRLQNQIEISQVEVKSFENDVGLMSNHIKNLKDELVTAYGEKKMLANDILEKNEAYLVLEREKNQIVTENYILENQVKELLGMTANSQEEKQVLIEERTVSNQKYTLLSQELKEQDTLNKHLDQKLKHAETEIEFLIENSNNNVPTIDQEAIEKMMIKFNSQINGFSEKVAEYEQALELKDKQIELLNELVRMGGRRRELDETLAGAKSQKYSRYSERIPEEIPENRFEKVPNMNEQEIMREIITLKQGQGMLGQYASYNSGSSLPAKYGSPSRFQQNHEKQDQIIQEDSELNDHEKNFFEDDDDNNMDYIPEQRYDSPNQILEEQEQKAQQDLYKEKIELMRENLRQRKMDELKEHHHQKMEVLKKQEVVQPGQQFEWSEDNDTTNRPENQNENIIFDQQPNQDDAQMELEQNNHVQISNQNPERIFEKDPTYDEPIQNQSFPQKLIPQEQDAPKSPNKTNAVNVREKLHEHKLQQLQQQNQNGLLRISESDQEFEQSHQKSPTQQGTQRSETTNMGIQPTLIQSGFNQTEPQQLQPNISNTTLTSQFQYISNTTLVNQATVTDGTETQYCYSGGDIGNSSDVFGNMTSQGNPEKITIRSNIGNDVINPISSLVSNTSQANRMKMSDDDGIIDPDKLENRESLDIGQKSYNSYGGNPLLLGQISELIAQTKAQMQKYSGMANQGLQTRSQQQNLGSDVVGSQNNLGVQQEKNKQIGGSPLYSEIVQTLGINRSLGNLQRGTNN